MSRSSSATTLENNPHAFSLDLAEIKKRARMHIEDGAVVEGSQSDREVILKLLNDALATEWVCVLRYRAHHYMSASMGGIAGFAVTGELLQHAKEEQIHADKLAERIVQLGGVPDLSPTSIAGRSHTDYALGGSLREMLTEDLIAERIAVETYTLIIRFVGEKDPTSRRLFEEILAQEEEHADELSDFLKALSVDA